MIKINEMIEDYLAVLNNQDLKNILDLGCGKGRLSLRFAEKGIKVTGIDNKQIPISQNNFNFICQDIRNFEFKEKYGLIIASLVLHFFKKEKAIKIIGEIKEKTKDDGFNLLICLSNKDDFSKQKPDNFYPNEKELKEIYSDWKIINLNQDFTEFEEQDNLKPHQHNIIFMLAKKLD